LLPTPWYEYLNSEPCIRITVIRSSRLSIKDVHSVRGKWVVHCEWSRSVKVLQMSTSEILLQKKLKIFRKLWCDVYTNKGRGAVNLLQFCADIFSGRPLALRTWMNQNDRAILNAVKVWLPKYQQKSGSYGNKQFVEVNIFRTVKSMNQSKGATRRGS